MRGVIAGVVLACAGCGETAPRANGRDLAPVATDSGGRIIWVNTHDPDQYRNWNEPVDRSRSGFFQRVGGKKVVLLTFDCAWVEPANALDVLDTLATHGVKATFFISGSFIFEDYRAGLKGGLKAQSLPVIRRLIDDGHEIGNHTRTHPHPADNPDYHDELGELRAGWDSVVRQLYGGSPPPNAAMRPFWRAPFGEYGAATLTAASCNGYAHHVGWNVDTFDSTGKPACDGGNDATCWDGRKMTRRVLRFAAVNGWSLEGIVIIGHLSNPYLWGASGGLAELITTFREHDYEFVRLSEAFRFDADYAGYPAASDLCRPYVPR